ncbi:FAD-binding oxidoreductase [Vibrio parahaemolyticus]|nr:FAD-binding oxidoreductase [Vibrio parahaemolyticus]EJB0384380.1 FAD-binding oxidoreductase [Vibrio parahaemolyticus]EJG1102019.1 FAD-binding oxidoreductase [Vibrio parahaemolyticus]ELA6664357.1 FAD-binding oxidoreductase [Vibrio parahaemolyticus]
MKSLENTTIEHFKSHFQGDIVLPTDSNYDEVRQIWNGMIDRKPSLIARCKSADDVVMAVNFARDNGQLLSVRGGGHNIAGNAVCDNGVMIDLSLLTQVRVDENAKRAFVEPGCTLGDLDEATQKHGLATPVGINSTTGIAGLTLGGGFGWLSRKYGMTIDNLVSANVVTADGRQLLASEKENEDLFWALRGGGGNFGIVTQFEFQLHPVGPEVLSGLIVFPFDQAKSIITQFAKFTESAPEELSVWMVSRKAPPLPFLPESVHGKEVVVLAICYAGDPSEGEKLIEPLRDFGDAHGEHVGVQPFAAWQQAFDPLLTPGARNYWKSHNFNSLSEGVIDAAIEYAGKLPSPQCEIFIASLGCVASRPEPESMAYSSRDANYVLNVHGRWDAAEDDQACIAWARDFFAKTKPYASGGAYINFLTQDEAERTEFAYGPTYARLQQIKKKYDPTNLFKMNQNIKPD